MAKTTWTFTAACVVHDNSFYVAGVADFYKDPFVKENDLFNWSPELARIDGRQQPWVYNTVDWRAVAVTTLMPDGGGEYDWWLCALSEEGDVLLTDFDFTEEKIPGAGVWGDDAKNWGYLSDLRQIGNYLYACGQNGQVYKRFGPNDWRHVDRGLLQAPETEMADSIELSAINGAHEKAIYAAGYQHAKGQPPRAFFYNGYQWQETDLPEEAERITHIDVESESRIWMCGANGTLLLGNHDEGFRSLSSINDNQLFTSLCKFQDRMYLASNLGLFVYDPQAPERGIEKVVTDLVPDLQNTHFVGCWDKVLWSIGPKDIARFDGKTWQRIHHPDNPQIS